MDQNSAMHYLKIMIHKSEMVGMGFGALSGYVKCLLVINSITWGTMLETFLMGAIGAAGGLCATFFAKKIIDWIIQIKKIKNKNNLK